MSRPREGPPRAHVPALDGLRGVAISLVMLYHFAPPSDASGTAAWLRAWMASGWCGVDLFFVLSGYLITRVLMAARGQQGALGCFYARRILRIFPLYYGVLVLVLWLGPHVLPYTAVEADAISRHQGWYWLYCANIPPGWDMSQGITLHLFRLDHFWSLSVEEQFYLAWPFLVLFLSHEAALGACAGVAAGAVVLRCLEALSHPNGLAVYFWTPYRLDGLALGSLLALLSLDPALLAWIRRFSRAGTLIGVVLLVTWGATHSGLHYGDATVQLFGYLLLALVSCGLVLEATRPAGEDGAPTFLSHPFLRFLGRYSYGLYVFHALLLPAYDRAFSQRVLAAGLGSEVLATLVYVGLAGSVSTLVAVVSHHAWEAPFLRLKARFEAPVGDANTPACTPG